MPEPSAPAPTDDTAPVLPGAACCAGACGPMFETPLLEQLFIRIRGAISGRADPAPTPTARPASGAEGWTTDD